MRQRGAALPCQPSGQGERLPQSLQIDSLNLQRIPTRAKSGNVAEESAGVCIPLVSNAGDDPLRKSPRAEEPKRYRSHGPGCCAAVVLVTGQRMVLASLGDRERGKGRGREREIYTRSHMHTRTHARMHARMHACTHARMHACTHARMHACTHARMHACTHACMHECRHAGTHAGENEKSGRRKRKREGVSGFSYA